MLILSLGYQLHFAINSGPFYLRFAQAADLPWLMPVFWIGFNLCLMPAGLLTRKLGPPSVMAFGAEAAMIGTAGAAFAPGLTLLLIAQFTAGAGWALLLCGAFSGALALGHTGREGLMSGAVSASLATAALARIGIVTAAPLAAGEALRLSWWPAVAFAVCAALLVRNALRR